MIAGRVLARQASALLDIACGPGDFLIYMSSVAPNLRLAGTDLAPGMVRHAREKLGNKAEIIEAVGDAQPFPSGSFDVITIMMAFHHFPKKSEALKKIKQLLKPGGILMIADVVASSDRVRGIWNVLEKIFGVRGFIEHYTKKDMEQAAHNAGLACDTTTIEGMASRYLLFTLS